MLLVQDWKNENVCVCGVFTVTLFELCMTSFLMMLMALAVLLREERGVMPAREAAACSVVVDSQQAAGLALELELGHMVGRQANL